MMVIFSTFDQSRYTQILKGKQEKEREREKEAQRHDEAGNSGISTLNPFNLKSSLKRACRRLGCYSKARCSGGVSKVMSLEMQQGFVANQKLEYALEISIF
jgi:hypothetical protein